jgi:Arc/MetJ-type ribon-helix-helix transcriptional regulator
VSKLDEIAQYAQTHDFAAEMQDGVWEDEVAADPMVTTSVRLPKSLLDWVREQAEREHMRPSVLIRQWLEQRREVRASASVEDLAVRVARLEEAVFPGSRAS